MRISFYLMFSLLWLISCSKDENKQVETSEISVSCNDSIELNLGDKFVIYLTGGNGKYKFSTQNKDIVSVALNENKLNLEAKREGNETILITSSDKRNKNYC